MWVKFIYKNIKSVFHNKKIFNPDLNDFNQNLEIVFAANG